MSKSSTWPENIIDNSPSPQHWCDRRQSAMLIARVLKSGRWSEAVGPAASPTIWALVPHYCERIHLLSLIWTMNWKHATISAQGFDTFCYQFLKLMMSFDPCDIGLNPKINKAHVFSLVHLIRPHVLEQHLSSAMVILLWTKWSIHKPQALTQ